MVGSTLFRLRLTAGLSLVLHAWTWPSTAMGAPKPLLEPTSAVVRVVEGPFAWGTPDSVGDRERACLIYSSHLWEAWFDSSSRIVVGRHEGALQPQGFSDVRGNRELSAGKKKREPKGPQLITAYDLERHQVLWTRQSEASVTGVTRGRLLLRGKGERRELYDVASAQLLGTADPEMWLLEPEGVALKLTYDEYARFNLADGARLWSRAGSSCTGFLQWDRQGDSLFVVADGLHAIDLGSGGGWSFATSTGRMAPSQLLTRESVKAIPGGSVLGVPGSNPVSGATRWDGAHNLVARPLIESDRIYFAARRTLFCLERGDGRVLWQADIGSEPGTMRLFHAGPYVALLGHGWGFVDFRPKPLARPLVALVSRDSGRVLGVAELEKKEELLECLWRPEGLFVLTAAHVLRYDPSMHLLGSLDATERSGGFRGFAPHESTLVVRGALLELSVDPRTLETIGSAPVRSSPSSYMEDLTAVPEEHIRSFAKAMREQGVDFEVQRAYVSVYAHVLQNLTAAWRAAGELEPPFMMNRFKPLAPSHGRWLGVRGDTLAVLSVSPGPGRP